MSDRRRRRGPRGERGAVLVVVVLALFVLVGAAGMGIDAGRMFAERRVAQGAADQASIAAAGAKCGGATNTAAVSAGIAAAARNGYDNDGVTNWVVLTQPATGRFRAVIRSTISATLSGALGFQLFEVAAQTLAGCDGGAPGVSQTIYAGGDNCTAGKYAVNVNGSTSRVYGGVHANSDMAVSGGNNQFTNGPNPPEDPVTYVGELKSGSTGNGNTFQPGYPQDVGPGQPDPAWPSGWAHADVAPLLDAYRTHAQAGYGVYTTGTISSITGDGVYYTTSTSGMDIGSVTGNPRNVVLVAPNGPIKVSVSSKTFNPYSHPDLPRQGILMVSGMLKPADKRCDEFVISMSGGATAWNGIIWAPGGLVQMSGSTNTAVNGSLIAWAVELNGSDLTIQYNSGLFPTTPGDVLIYE